MTFVVFLNEYNNKAYQSVEVFFKPYALYDQIEIFGIKENILTAEMVSAQISNSLDRHKDNKLIFVYTKKSRNTKENSDISPDKISFYRYKTIMEKILKDFDLFASFQKFLICIDTLEKDENGEYKDNAAKEAYELDKAQLQELLETFSVCEISQEQSFDLYIKLISLILLIHHDTNNEFPKKEWYIIDRISVEQTKLQRLKELFLLLKVESEKNSESVELYDDQNLPTVTLNDQIHIVDTTQSWKMMLENLKDNNKILKNVNLGNSVNFSSQKYDFILEEMREKVNSYNEYSATVSVSSLSHKRTLIEDKISEIEREYNTIAKKSTTLTKMKNSLFSLQIFMIVLASLFLYDATEDNLKTFFIDNYIVYMLLVLFLFFVVDIFKKILKHKKEIKRLESVLISLYKGQIELKEEIINIANKHIRKRLYEKNKQKLEHIISITELKAKKERYHKEKLSLMQRNISQVYQVMYGNDNKNSNSNSKKSLSIKPDKPLWQQSIIEKIYHDPIIKSNITVTIDGKDTIITSPTFVAPNIYLNSIVKGGR